MKTACMLAGVLVLLASCTVSGRTQSNLRRVGTSSKDGQQHRDLETAEFSEERKAFFTNLIRSESTNFKNMLQQALEAQDPMFFPDQEDHGYYYAPDDKRLLDLGTISSGPCQGQQARVQFLYQRIRGHSSGELQSDASSLDPEDLYPYASLDCSIPDGCEFDLYGLINYTATNSNLELDMDMVFSTREGNCPTSFGTARIVAPTATMSFTTKVVGTISLYQEKSEIREYIRDASWKMDASTNFTVGFHDRFDFDGHDAYDTVLKSTARILTDYYLGSDGDDHDNKLEALFRSQMNKKTETLPMSAWEEDVFTDFIQRAKGEESVSWWNQRLMAPIIYIQNVALLTFWLFVNPDNFYY